MIIKAFNDCDNLKRSIALGNFDGVHIAHKEVIKAAVNYAKEMGVISSVVTFSLPPALVLGYPVALLSQKELKEECLRDLGIDELIYIDFDDNFSSLSPIDFFNILKDKLGAVSLSCGFNYRFGKNKEGNSQILFELCKENNIRFFSLNPITADGETVSSSLIRKLITEGNIKKANELLGRPFEITNSVISGNHLGTSLNFPTANQTLPKNFVIPRFGVYITETEIENKSYRSVTNIGNRPTVDGNEVFCETNIFDFSGNIYGKEVKIKYYDFLRDEKKFSSLLELKTQVDADILTAKEYVI